MQEGIKGKAGETQPAMIFFLLATIFFFHVVYIHQCYFSIEY